jgi:hypothetical protein
MEQVSFHKRIQAGERPCLEATQVEEVSKWDDVSQDHDLVCYITSQVNVVYIINKIE